jgi:hypothetical protein
MKYLLLILCLASFCLQLSAQITDSSKTKTYEYYMHKSKAQKTTGFIVLGTGAGISVISLIIGLSPKSAATALEGLFGPNPRETWPGEITFFAGLAVMAGSIPFFAASGRNRKKAGSIHAFFKVQTMSYPGLITNLNKPYPSLAIRINLKY